MPYVLIIHEVADYPVWKKIFDGAAGIRQEAGERSFQVLKYVNDPTRIVHFSAWTSIDDARRFFESPQLVSIRAEAGVKAPEFIYLEQEAGHTAFSATLGTVRTDGLSTSRVSCPAPS